MGTGLLFGLFTLGSRMTWRMKHFSEEALFLYGEYIKLPLQQAAGIQQQEAVGLIFSFSLTSKSSFQLSLYWDSTVLIYLRARTKVFPLMTLNFFSFLHLLVWCFRLDVLIFPANAEPSCCLALLTASICHPCDSHALLKWMKFLGQWWDHCHVNLVYMLHCKCNWCLGYCFLLLRCLICSSVISCIIKMFVYI